jgi:hypothetical protein
LDDVHPANHLQGKTHERLEQGDTARAGTQRMDKAILGGGETRLARAATLPKLPQLPASALRDLREVHERRFAVRTRGPGRLDLCLHDHVPHGRQAVRAAVPYASIIVELDEAPGALMAGNLLGAPVTEAKVGRRVEVFFEKLNEDITLPQFKLAASSKPTAT